MSPLEASDYFPAPEMLVADDLVVIPDVDCGEGYRQLKWLEEIERGDEYFGGKDGDRKWEPTLLGVGSRYRPHTANSIYAPWSIIRRKCSE